DRLLAILVAAALGRCISLPAAALGCRISRFRFGEGSLLRHGLAEAWVSLLGARIGGPVRRVVGGACHGFLQSDRLWLCPAYPPVLRGKQNLLGLLIEVHR